MNIKNIGFIAILLAVFVVFGSAPSAMAATDSFDRSLSVGAQGPEVTKLQQFLIDQSYLGIATPTGYFGQMTKAAVANFQESHGISKTGYFGPLSRARANANIQVAVTPEAKSTVSLLSVSSTNDNAGAVLQAGSKDIRWKTSEYPSEAGVNINLLRKTNESPNTYELVRQIASNTTNDGEATWSPGLTEKSSNLFIEVTCATEIGFDGGCRVATDPAKAF